MSTKMYGTAPGVKILEWRNYGNGIRFDQHGARTHARHRAGADRSPGITEAYSVAGPYDLVAVARVRHHEELANLVAGRVQKIPGIETTNTLIAFQAYSQRDLEAMWDIGNTELPG